MERSTLDLASVAGWAVGEPGGKPAHGSTRFASIGASHEAIFAGAVKWINALLNDHEPTLVVWEAPLQGFKGGKTTNDVTTVLLCRPRSSSARRFRDLVRSYEAELGGELSEAERSLVRQAVALQLQAERLQEAIVRGEAVGY